MRACSYHAARYQVSICTPPSKVNTLWLHTFSFPTDTFCFVMTAPQNNTLTTLSVLFNKPSASSTENSVTLDISRLWFIGRLKGLQVCCMLSVREKRKTSTTLYQRGANAEMTEAIVPAVLSISSPLIPSCLALHTWNTSVRCRSESGAWPMSY